MLVKNRSVTIYGNKTFHPCGYRENTTTRSALSAAVVIRRRFQSHVNLRRHQSAARDVSFILPVLVRWTIKKKITKEAPHERAKCTAPLWNEATPLGCGTQRRWDPRSLPTTTFVSVSPLARCSFQACFPGTLLVRRSSISLGLDEQYEDVGSRIVDGPPALEHRSSLLSCPVLR